MTNERAEFLEHPRSERKQLLEEYFDPKKEPQNAPSPESPESPRHAHP